ncbi:MAG: CmcI family methyltransferase, partial [Aquihabitans sp.]
PLGSPTPVPEDQRDRFIDSYWRSHAWRNTSWLGRPVQNAVSDLVTYQEIINEIRPDWIIETGTRNGGRALFLASICDLIGHGQVVSIERATDPDRPVHERITYVTGAPQLPETVGQVRALVGDHPHGLVILGTRGRRNRMRDEFDAYAPMVGIGSYAIVEHTMLNGWPVDGSFGHGPFEAVRGILAGRGDFVVDTEREKHALTFNPFGFLRRIS